jgi:hypothetical protein
MFDHSTEAVDPAVLPPRNVAKLSHYTTHKKKTTKDYPVALKTFAWSSGAAPTVEYSIPC